MVELRDGLTIQSITRGIKLKLLDGLQWKPSRGIDSKKLKLLKKHFDDNEIISGSLALSLFFDLQRKIGDIDVVSSRPHRFGDLYKTNYPEWNFLKDYEGSKDFSNFFGNNLQRVDFFRYDAKFLIWKTGGFWSKESFKIQDPLEIIEKKSKIIMESDVDQVKEKHSIDLEIIGMKILHDIDIRRRSTGSYPEFCLKY